MRNVKSILFKRFVRLGLAALFSMTALFTASGIAPAHAATMTVSTAADDNSNNGNCSLREAIRAAVNHTQVDQCATGTSNDLITFASGVNPVINSPLPAITAGNIVTIYGGSQKHSLTTNFSSGNVFTANAGSTLSITNIIFQGTGGTCIQSAGNLTLTGDQVQSCSMGINATGGQVTVQTSSVVRIDTHSGNASFNASDSNFAGGVPFSVYLGWSGGTITRSTFGAGQVGIASLGSLNISRTIFNNASSLAHISVSGTTVTLTNSILTGATQGALDPENGAQFRVVNSTIVGNANGVTGSGTVFFKNTVLNNATNCGSANISVVDNGGNLESSASCGSIPVGNTALGANYTPQAGSPLIDSGIVAGCPSTDYYGAARPKDGDANGSALCDIGAVEK